MSDHVPAVQRGEHRAAAGRVRAPGRGRGGDAEVGLQPARARGQEVSIHWSQQTSLLELQTIHRQSFHNYGEVSRHEIGMPTERS